MQQVHLASHSLHFCMKIDCFERKLSKQKMLTYTKSTVNTTIGSGKNKQFSSFSEGNPVNVLLTSRNCQKYFYQWYHINWRVHLALNENREVLVDEVSLNPYLVTLFSFCKVWQLQKWENVKQYNCLSCTKQKLAGLKTC